MLKRILLALLALLFIFPTDCYALNISASSAVVIDCDTKTVLYNQDMYSRRSMASTTKIMTCLIAIESNRLDEYVEITKEMVNVEGSSLGIKEGDKITLYDLLVGMMLTSGNDSANAVAVFISGSIDAFIAMMNDRAEQIGMLDTEFVTPSGLDEGNHHSTAYDMALLTCEAVKNETFCRIVSMRSADICVNDNKITVYNHNKLLAMDDNIFGVKTGYTKLAGRCLVSAKKFYNNTIICVTLNCPDDWNDHLALYKQCEKEYTKVTVDKEYSVPVVTGNKGILASVRTELYCLGIVTYKAYYYPLIYAPIRKGDGIGYVDLYCKNTLIERLPIEADEDFLDYGRQQSGTTSEIYGGIRRRFSKKK